MTTAAPGLLLVHAHPDDETLWTGGTIARYVGQGMRVTLVTCTLGEEGEIIPPSLRELAAAAADQLGGYRVGELRAACMALGIADQRFLGGMGRWRDSGMAGTAANDHPRAFIRGAFDEQVAALRAVIADVAPRVVITYDAHGGYGHPDHIRAHDITMAATAELPESARVFHTVRSRRATEAGVTALAGLPDLPFPLPTVDELDLTDDETITTVIDVRARRAAVLQAMRAHATQVSVWEQADHRAYALSNGIAAPILDTEHYVLVRGPSTGVAVDLFGGLDLAHARRGLTEGST